MSSYNIQIAVPAGKLLNAVKPLLTSSGLNCSDRSSSTPNVELNVVSPETAREMMANEKGFADICVVSSEAFLEEWIDNWQYARDLCVARRRLSLVAKAGTTFDLSNTLRVATHYPLISRAHLQTDQFNLELIEPSVGMSLSEMLESADVAVVVINNDEPLSEHGLVELRRICPVSAHALVSQHTLEHKRAHVDYVLRQLTGQVGKDGVASDHHTRNAA